MDLRGSSSSLASGLRVSAIPPAPMCWPMAVDRVIWVEGAKAEAEATRAAMTASLYCNDRDTKEESQKLAYVFKVYNIDTALTANCLQ